MNVSFVFRFFYAIGVVAFGSLLLGAAPIVPTVVLAAPVLVVFPFSVNGDAQKESGAKLAILIGTQIANLGGVAVKPGAPGTPRAEFLNVARATNADYYLSGYVTPIGDEVTVVEQLVSTQTGIIAFSNTAQIKTYAEAGGQGDLLRTALLRHQGRNIAAYEQLATPSPATPTPGTTSGSQATLSGLFKKKKSTPQPVATKAPALIAVVSPEPAGTIAPLSTMAPRNVTPPRVIATPTPVPTPVPTHAPEAVSEPRAPSGADRSYLVLAFGGSADSERRDYATTQIAAEIDRRKLHGIPTSAVQITPELCATNGANRAIGGALSTKAGDPAFGQNTTATMLFVVYECNGTTIFKKTFEQDASGNRDWQTAVDRVVGMATGAYLTPKKRSR